MTNFSKLLAAVTAAGTIGLTGAGAIAQNAGSPKAACAVADAPAQLLSHPDAEFPSLTSSDMNGIVVLEIHLWTDGSLRSAVIRQSSGFPSLDQEAMRVARNSRFQPETVQCQSIEGGYLYTVTFDR
ncbi:MAG TPA: energy transducer TonB [Candidatus Baltobacteraceae bacterium]|nr:energy transducer TonB [Candidatus Baltobacteraceae bacterium]